MILDDGGDATLLVHLGMQRREQRHACSRQADNEEEEVLFAAIKAR